MKSKIFRILSVVINILILVISVSGCGEEQSQKQTIVCKKITLGVGSGLFLSSIWVAENNGYFQEAGLDLTVTEFSTGKAAFIDMLNGGVDISTVAPTPVMFSSFTRDDFSMFATFAYSDDNVKLIANTEKGINRVEDLKGKRIGTAVGTSAQFFLTSFLLYNGLYESEIEVVNIKPPDLPQAIQSGEIDAIAIWEPFAHTAMKLLGDKAIKLPGLEIYRETFNLMVMNDFAIEEPETLKRFVIAIDKATKFIQNNKEEAQKIVFDRLKLDKELMRVLWDNYVFELSLDQSLIVTLENEARWAIKNELTKGAKIPNYLDYIYLDALKEVVPEAIDIY